MANYSFKVGNAPCSWGTIENTAGTRLTHTQMLNELVEAGYTGTELGDWGFMPTEPEDLREELEARNLDLIGSWVTVRLYDESYHLEGAARAVQVAKLLAEVGGPQATINIGDDHSTIHARHYNTGRISKEHFLSEQGWKAYIKGVESVAKMVKNETGLRSCLHPHGSTYVETPEEIDRFLSLSDPDLVGIVFDTGHYMLGGGDPVEGIKRYQDRIWLMHFKDFNPQVVEEAKRHNWNYQDMIGAGVFSELGKGAVDFPAVLEAMQEINYQGWIVVEQDVLPGMGSPFESAKRNREYLASIGL
ncbi:MAG: TIM barrel protein [Deinococcales bacterium]